MKNAARFYGPYFPVYNVHNLLHLYDDANYHKLPLFDMPACAFDNYMKNVNRGIRKSTELAGVSYDQKRCSKHSFHNLINNRTSQFVSQILNRVPNVKIDSEIKISK